MTAVAERVDFPFNLALPAAAQMWSLAQMLAGDVEPQRQQAARTALEEFKGRFADDFTQRMATSGTNAGNAAQDLEQAAMDIAEAWADANYQQQLYAYYAMVQDKRNKANSGIVNEVGNFLFGDHTDYGEPPKKPAVPSPPEFAATYVPQADVPGESYVLR